MTKRREYGGDYRTTCILVGEAGGWWVPEFLETLGELGVEVADDPELDPGIEGVRRVLVTFPTASAVRSARARGAGRKPRSFELPADSRFRDDDPISAFVDWLEGKVDGRRHTDAEGMAELGIGAKTTYRRRRDDMRLFRDEPDCTIGEILRGE